MYAAQILDQTKYSADPAVAQAASDRVAAVTVIHKPSLLFLYWAYHTYIKDVIDKSDRLKAVVLTLNMD